MLARGLRKYEDFKLNHLPKVAYCTCGLEKGGLWIASRISIRSLYDITEDFAIFKFYSQFSTAGKGGSKDDAHRKRHQGTYSLLDSGLNENQNKHLLYEDSVTN